MTYSIVEQTQLTCFVLSTTGGFDVTGVDFEKLAAHSQKLRNLANVLRKHIQLDSRKKKINPNAVAVRKRDEQNRDIGTFSYSIYPHDLLFTFLASFMPWFTLGNIDMGEVNHSTRFIECTKCWLNVYKLFQTNPPCLALVNPCRERENPCRKRENPCRERENPCRERENSYRERENP